MRIKYFIQKHQNQTTFLYCRSNLSLAELSSTFTPTRAAGSKLTAEKITRKNLRKTWKNVVQTFQNCQPFLWATTGSHVNGLNAKAHWKSWHQIYRGKFCFWIYNTYVLKQKIIATFQFYRSLLIMNGKSQLVVKHFPQLILLPKRRLLMSRKVTKLTWIELSR